MNHYCHYSRLPLILYESIVPALAKGTEAFYSDPDSMFHRLFARPERAAIHKESTIENSVPLSCQRWTLVDKCGACAIRFKLNMSTVDRVRQKVWLRGSFILR